MPKPPSIPSRYHAHMHSNIRVIFHNRKMRLDWPDGTTTAHIVADYEHTYYNKHDFNYWTFNSIGEVCHKTGFFKRASMV